MSTAVLIKIKGRVQGVGFRPFVFQLADKYKIKGTVQNNMDGVRIVAEGEQSQLASLLYELKKNAPRLSRIDIVSVEDIAQVGHSDFSIIPSNRSGASSLVIPIDASVCDDCLEEMNDPTNFRYQYPFINCTACGPRYTIIEELPYDRPYTVMKEFIMCDDCRKEYEDPTNRRHHAQPIACPNCGPTVTLFAMNGEELSSKNDAIAATKKLLEAGKIVAIKGIGGYHLACDAKNEQAIATLRERKHRPQKPLAIMAKNIDVVSSFCSINELESDTLTSTAAPIVILQKQHRMLLPEIIAPGMKTVGVMLPYTPLHYLLFQDSLLDLLVMTSANPSGLPMLHKDEEAFSYLNGIADYVLTANRQIIHPIDDSVVQVIDGELTFLRRGRGYVPDPLFTEQQVDHIVALGSQQKNTFAIGRKEEIFVGPHIGDLNHFEMTLHFTKELNHLLRWLGPFSDPVIAIDKHPDYAIRELADNFPQSKVVEVQHHHAHHVACMADNELVESCFGIILDGTGYGEDGHIWGFEILYGDASGFKRLAHLRYTPLPGGERAINEPWRNAVAMLIELLGAEGKGFAEQLFPNKSYEISIIENMVIKRMNSPLAGTCGRLFDAVSAILNICTTSSYDGEAAVKLSEKVPFSTVFTEKPYPYELKQYGDLMELDFSSCLRAICVDHLAGNIVEEIAARFHETIVACCVEAITTIAAQHNDFNHNVVLSGGSIHNPFLVKEMKRLLENRGFNVYTHKNVPCNDGGLSLGQLMVAAFNKKN